MMGDFRMIQGEYFKALNEFNEYESDMADQAGKEAEQGAATATRVISLCLAAAVGFSVLIAFLLVRDHRADTQGRSPG